MEMKAFSLIITYLFAALSPSGFYVKKQAQIRDAMSNSSFTALRQSDIRYRFDHTISREVLNNYLSRAVTHYGLCASSPEPASAYFEDDLRMLTQLRAKFVGLAAYAWVPPADDEVHFRLAEQCARRVHQKDPEMILQAGIFEAVYERVDRIPIPAWVFQEFGLPVERRNFRYAAMLYNGAKYKNHWGQGASVPDITKRETQMYFYYRARRYIDSGFEAIRFGQVHLVGQNDAGYRHWGNLLSRVRKYAARKARRHLVLCDAHTHGIVIEGNHLLFDFHGWPQRLKEVGSSPMKVILEKGFGDSIYGKSAGGIAPSGWFSARHPYLVEFDTFGASGKEGKAGYGFPWIWGYDEGGWLAHAPEAVRRSYLTYAHKWLRSRKEDGWLQMPTRVNLAVAVEGQHLWHANTRSKRCPVCFGLEETIKSIWQSEGNVR
jgi:hypothetical protein